MPFRVSTPPPNLVSASVPPLNASFSITPLNTLLALFAPTPRVRGEFTTPRTFPSPVRPLMFSSAFRRKTALACTMTLAVSRMMLALLIWRMVKFV